MMWDWQTGASLVIVMFAACYIARRVRQAVRQPQGMGCSGCGPGNSTGIKAKPLIQLENPTERS